MQEVWGLFGMLNILFKDLNSAFVGSQISLVSGYKLKAHVNKANIVLLNVLIFKTTFIKNKKS